MKKWISIITLIACLPFTIACQNGMEAKIIGVDNLASGGDPSPGTGSLKLDFTNPVAGVAPAEKVTVSINATPIGKVQSLRLLINDVPVKEFTRVPFEYLLDPSLYSGNISLKAESRDISGNTNTETIVLTRSGGTTIPGSSKTAGTRDPNCMNNNAFDACIFWKNPVAHKGSPFATKLHFGDDLSAVQTFGVKLKNQSSANSLSSSSISVIASSGQTAAPGANSWRFPYQTDTNHFDAQLMAYFWLTLQETEMVSRSGTFFARNKGIPVDAYRTSGQYVNNNAYWDGQQIVMGYATTGGSPAHEMAMGSEVYLHEMGHANLEFGVGGHQNLDANPSYEYQSGGNGYCRTTAGCIGGVNEGQADFHFLIIFNDSTPLGETWTNSMGGLADRNVANNQSLTATDAFSSGNGEIHDMGAFYAAVLWSIYSNPQVSKVEFEKIFVGHLQQLTGSTRFAEARDALIASDQALFSGKYKTIIQAAFSSKGI